MSTTRESQPIWAMTSADQLEGMPHQLLMTALPSASISRIRFDRAIHSSIAPRGIGPIPPAKTGEVKRRRPRRLFFPYSAGEEPGERLFESQGRRHVAPPRVEECDRAQ